jgi:hypothetical protein
VSFRPTIISTNAVLLAFKLANRRSEVDAVGLAVSSNINFDGEAGAPCTVIAPGTGFVICSVLNAFSFVLRDYPLVADVSISGMAAALCM